MRFMLTIVLCVGAVSVTFAKETPPVSVGTIAKEIKAPALEKVVLEKNYKVRIEAAKELTSLDEKAAPANKFLIEVVREEVLKLARPLGPDDRLATEQLTRACVDVLAKTGKNDDNVFALFKKLATNPDIKHPNSIFALQTLIEWAKDNNDKLKEIYPLVVAGIRNNANAPDYIALLPTFGDRARSATSTLRPLTTSDNPLVRASAEKALGYLDRK